MMREVVASFPPLIAESNVQVPAALAAEMDSAIREIVALDAEHAPDLGALTALLLRTESVASSRIEEIDASMDDYARALHGAKANPSATAMVDAAAATDSLLAQVTKTRTISLASLTTAHHELMRDDPAERHYAGRVRDMQNWIGGSKYSPRDALYVPPPQQRVPEYLEDLIRYVNRDDVPVLLQASIGHAQFESIHPFTDGNGRIGRALVNSIFRRRAVTTAVVVPLASALVAHRDRYFDDLAAYRAGNLVPLVRSFALGSRIAAGQARTTAHNLAAIAKQWQDMIGSVRSHSATAKILESLLEQPVLTADEVSDRLSLSASSAYAAVERLHLAGVLRPLTNRKRNQVWAAGLVLDELDALGARIKKAAT